MPLPYICWCLCLKRLEFDWHVYSIGDDIVADWVLISSLPKRTFIFGFDVRKEYVNSQFNLGHKIMNISLLLTVCSMNHCITTGCRVVSNSGVDVSHYKYFAFLGNLSNVSRSSSKKNSHSSLGLLIIGTYMLIKNILSQSNFRVAFIILQLISRPWSLLPTDALFFWCCLFTQF